MNADPLPAGQHPQDFCGEAEAEARVARPAPPLPCLLVNNTNGEEAQPIAPTCSSYRKRKAEAARVDTQRLIETWGVNNTAFITITFENKVTEKKEAYRLWNNFRGRVWKGAGISEAVKFMEEHEDGSLHIHIVGDAGEDIRTGFDFGAFDAARKMDRRGNRHGLYFKFTRIYGASASERLRALWSYFSERRKKYRNIGRISIEPIKGSSEAASFYLAKYLTTGHGKTVFKLNGLHRVEYLGCKPNHSTQFTRATPKGWARREQMKRWARSIGCGSLDELREKFKRRDGKTYWNKIAHRYQSHIYSPKWFGRDDVFPTLAHAQAAGMSCDGIPSYALQITGLRPKLDFFEELRMYAREAWQKGDKEEARELWRMVLNTQRARQPIINDGVSEEEHERRHQLAVKQFVNLHAKQSLSKGIYEGQWPNMGNWGGI